MAQDQHNDTMQSAFSNHAQHLPTPPASPGQEESDPVLQQLEALANRLETIIAKMPEAIRAANREAIEKEAKLSDVLTGTVKFEKDGQTQLVVENVPLLNSVSKADCLAWYLKLQPFLKAIQVFPVQDQITYIGETIEESLDDDDDDDGDGDIGIDEERYCRINGMPTRAHPSNQPFNSVKELLTYVTKDCYGLHIEID
ncbi:hypothetical protein LTS08_007453 [Lithohypha guttulata]|nr:hypothetical protein LTS08_007453 [Lithohypha guttulata]